MNIYDAGGHRGPPLRVNVLLFVIPAYTGMTVNTPDWGMPTIPLEGLFNNRVSRGLRFW